MSTATRARRPKMYHGTIRLIPIGKLRPAPENDQVYKPVDPDDPEIVALAQSIREHGIREPLIVTKDICVLSGHRRLVAAELAGLATVPCRMLLWRRVDRPDEFLRLLRESNRQRVKTFAEVLREQAIDTDPDIAYQALIAHREGSGIDIGDKLHIDGKKRRAEITSAKWPLLDAIGEIIEARRNFWPLSDRQIHYALLNDPPLIHASKPDSRYRNDGKSYHAIVELLTRARLLGGIRMEAIDDPTRPVTLWHVHHDVSGYLREQIDQFGNNYWRDLLQSQPNHIEVIGEKNTIAPIIRPVAAEYCIPVTIGRGYCSLRPRYDIAQRFRKSGKDRLVLLIVSDFDPEGEDIAHSLARSLRDDFGVYEITPVKVALSAEQVEELDLPPACQAKNTSSRYKRFSKKHGDDVWELEALPPETLQEILREAIDSVLDIEAFNHEVDREKEDAAKLAAVRGAVVELLRAYQDEEPDA